MIIFFFARFTPIFTSPIFAAAASALAASARRDIDYY